MSAEQRFKIRKSEGINVEGDSLEIAFIKEEEGDEQDWAWCACSQNIRANLDKVKKECLWFCA